MVNQESASQRRSCSMQCILFSMEHLRKMLFLRGVQMTVAFLILVAIGTLLFIRQHHENQLVQDFSAEMSAHPLYADRLHAYENLLENVGADRGQDILAATQPNDA